ncbi:HAMP domain-containing histidine kinase [Labilibacter marinus]|uniref:HAMP domain-containing histidine kinase n=1 Tax=Labilibacter marinus TaxID=1477105 RepID=UPI0008306BEF|nr:HAMP domain-containing histidine kinase [Labilibacter marinus]
MFNFGNIRTRLQITLGILVIVIITVSGVLNFFSAKDSLFDRYRDRQFSLIVLRSAQSNLQAKLERAMETSELLAKDPTLISWFVTDENSLYKELSLHRLDHIHKSYSYETVFAVDASTLNYWSEDFKKLEVLDWEDDDDSWYFNTIQNKVTTSLNFDHNNKLGRTMLFVNVLMYHEDSIVGIAGVGVDPSDLLREIEFHKPTKNSNIWLVREDGRVVVASNLNDVHSNIEKFLTPQTVEYILSDQDKGIVPRDVVEGDSEVSFLRLSGTEYKLVMHSPKHDLFPVLDVIKVQTFWFSLLFFAITLFVVAVLSKRITKPLLRLQNITEKFSEGDLHLVVDKSLLHRQDEIGLLAKAFDKMKSQLSSYIDKVNHANEELSNEKEQLKKANMQLNVALNKASESERLTQSFLANISHEIRTPMNSILGFSQLLEFVEADSADHKIYAGHVVRGGQQLLTILDSIINLSKIESGVIKPIIEPILVNAMLEETFELYKVLGDQKGLRMHLDIDTNNDELKVDSDIALFQLVLNNLISNAIKYTKEGFINIGYKKTKGSVDFYISDTGIGISKDNLDSVFKPFRQVQLNQSETTGGAGLGLAIVSKVLNILGGSISVYSELGKGSTFTVSMPLKG